jgi:hypothetical protein
MSAERRFDQRRFHLEESVRHNGGARTVFIEHMTPGTTVPPHYHSRQYMSSPPYSFSRLSILSDHKNNICTIPASIAGH